MSALPSLFHLAQDHLELQRRLQDLDHEDDSPEGRQALMDTLEGLNGLVEVKSQACAAVVLNLEAMAQAAKDAARALELRARRMQQRAESLKSYVQGQMAALEIKKIEGPQFTLLRQLNPPSLQTDPGFEAPPEYLSCDEELVDAIVFAARELPGNQDLDADIFLSNQQLADVVRSCLPSIIDKAAIKADLKAGKQIEGAWLTQAESLRIRT